MERDRPGRIRRRNLFEDRLERVFVHINLTEGSHPMCLARRQTPRPGRSRFQGPLLRFFPGLDFERVVGKFNERGKSRGVRGCQIGNDLAIQGALGGLQTFHETAVSRPGGTGGGVDAYLPKSAECALFGLAITIRVLHSVIERVGRVTIQLGALETKTLGGLDCANPALAGGG